jgi:hypothetical protein
METTYYGHHIRLTREDIETALKDCARLKAIARGWPVPDSRDFEKAAAIKLGDSGQIVADVTWQE